MDSNISVKEKVQSLVCFDLSYILGRLKKEYKLANDSSICDVVYDVVNIVINYIHQYKIPALLETTVYEMVKDYWDYNRYKVKDDEIIIGSDDDDSSDDVKKIKRGNEEIEFKDTNITKINGRSYSTGTLEPTEDYLIKKYKNRLNTHRKMRW